MADKKISQLTAASLPLDGTEVLPIVQSSATVKVANSDLRPKQILSNATTGVLQIAGPGAGTTRVMTTPNANFTAARTDAAQTFTGTQTFSGSYANFVQDVTKSSLRIGSDGANDIYLPGTTALGISGLAGIALNAGTGLPRAVLIGTTGNVTIDAGNVIFSTAAKGVNFTANTGAAGMTSQLLNWYEEGTWTPNQGAGLTVVGAFSSSGTYTRVGRLVLVNGTVSGATSVAIAATATQICTNLPFNCTDGHSGTMFNAALGATGGIAASAGIVYAVTTMGATTSITFTIAYRT